MFDMICTFVLIQKVAIILSYIIPGGECVYMLKIITLHDPKSLILLKLPKHQKSQDHNNSNQLNQASAKNYSHLHFCHQVVFVQGNSPYIEPIDLITYRFLRKTVFEPD